MFESLFIAGIGGQGIVTLANLLTGHTAAIGLKFSLFNSTGMAQRGGRVTSEIRISEDENFIFGPRISPGGADILIGMELAEAVNSFSFLKADGLAIIMNYSYIPSETILKKKEYPSFNDSIDIFAKKTKNLYAIENPLNPMNMFALGFFSALRSNLKGRSELFSYSNIKQAIEEKMKKNLKENLKTFHLGYQYGKDYKTGS